MECNELGSLNSDPKDKKVWPCAWMASLKSMFMFLSRLELKAAAFSVF